MRRFCVLTWSMLLITLRDHATLFWGIAFPIGLTVLYGTITAKDGVDTISWLATGVVALTIMSAGLMSEAGHFTEMRELGTLQRVHATPLPPIHLFSAALLVRLLVTLIQATLVLAVAALGFGVPISGGSFVAGCMVALLGTAVFFALGQALGATAQTPRAAAAFGQALYFPLMFVSNLFVPATLLPAWITQIARFTPAFLLVDVLRPAFIPGMPAAQAAWIDAIGLTMYAVLGMAVFARFFRWSPRG